MANKVKYGLTDVHYAEYLGTDDQGNPKYDTPVALPGAVNLTKEAESNESAFWADNKKFYVSYAKTGYTGELEIALIPEHFLKTILGQKEEGNIIAESPEDKFASFALGYRLSGDVEDTLFWDLYNDVSAPKSELSTTEDTIEPKTDTMSITSTSVKVDGKERARVRTKEGTPQSYKDT